MVVAVVDITDAAAVASCCCYCSYWRYRHCFGYFPLLMLLLFSSVDFVSAGGVGTVPVIAYVSLFAVSAGSINVF